MLCLSRDGRLIEQGQLKSLPLNSRAHPNSNALKHIVTVESMTSTQAELM